MCSLAGHRQMGALEVEAEEAGYPLACGRDARIQYAIEDRRRAGDQRRQQRGDAELGMCGADRAQLIDIGLRSDEVTAAAIDL
jgi:hypothetical protein